MQSVIITGGNEGIGYHMVQQFLADGKSVAVIDLNDNQLLPLQAHYPDCLIVAKGDVRDGAFVREVALQVVEKFDTIDYAIHNACICPFASFDMLSNEDYQNTFAVNYFGAIHLCRAVLPVMAQQRSGRVYFTSSTVGVTGFSRISSYASSKGALEALAKCLQLEYQDSGIGFHILHPTLTRTTSAAPLPIPEEMKVDAEIVGRGLAKRIDKRKFIICHSTALQWQTKLMYLFPLRVGKFMDQGTKRLMKKG